VSQGPVRQTAPCRGACPAGTDAAAYVALLAEGRTEEAYDVARAPNPLVSVSGRICAAPCESGCRRRVVDQPVAIRALKRALTERHGVEAGAQSRWSRALGPLPEATRPSVGIVGAGPAGLSAAHDLRRAGHAVTLYEREARPGGMLYYGAPAFRLPQEVAQAEFQAILDLGVEIRTGCAVGVDITLDALLEKHAAILVAIGCQQGNPAPFPGVELDGVIHALDFLRQVNTMETAHTPVLDGPCVVIGGGSVAFDAARSALRRQDPAGGHPVTLVARRAKAQLRAPVEEVTHGLEEGVQLRAGYGVCRIIGSTRVEAVEIAPLLSIFDDAGHYAPAFDLDRTQTLEARSVILSVGQRAESTFLESLPGLAAASWRQLDADHSGCTSHPRIFAAGDVATGPGNLIEAVAFGQRAAAAIVHALSNQDDPQPCGQQAPTTVPTAPALSRPRRYWSGYDTVARAAFPAVAPDQRSGCIAVELPLGEAVAQQEASRCLRCDEHLQLSAGSCIACALCEDVCPSGCLSLERADNGISLLFDDDRCIRCRLCVDRCPANALDFAAVTP